MKLVEPTIRRAGGDDGPIGFVRYFLFSSPGLHWATPRDDGFVWHFAVGLRGDGGPLPLTGGQSDSCSEAGWRMLQIAEGKGVVCDLPKPARGQSRVLDRCMVLIEWELRAMLDFEYLSLGACPSCSHVPTFCHPLSMSIRSWL